ncbi:MAG: helix-turn-helix domain-containing protein [Desulfomonile tiedjei]|uniref:Helix-turn-helix domain-containing protein n=1 Tax=Desulfomonile tiedjei TaxID=2358 RepID=A0A9D6V283_9BACT|nr:helix-turn-helix domain-containing protein [Desulfomonile tiedjei]
MRKNEARKIAEKAFLEDRGRLTNKEIAQKLGIHPATVARWKKMDEWDLKLVQSLSRVSEVQDKGEDFYAVDVRHLSLLNERIDAYLRKKELLPSEILELSEAKYHIMSCMEMINEQMRYSLSEEFHEDEEFD